MKTCKKQLHQYEDHFRTCPECRRVNSRVHKKNYQIKNKDKIAAQVKIYQAKNKSSISAQKKIYQVKNKSSISAYQKEYRIKNKDKKKRTNRAYYNKNKDEILAKQKVRLAKPEIKEKNNQRHSARKALDSLYKLSCTLRTLICVSSKRTGWRKSSKSQKILGCTFEELKNHLEATAIKNYESLNPLVSYVIDHIIPISLARNEEEMLKLNHYSNLQYLTEKDNLQKINKVFDLDGVEITDLDKKIEILDKFLTP